MEQVEQALRKAREQGQTTARGFFRRAWGRDRESASFAYTQTRTDHLVPEILERNRVVAAQFQHPLTDVYRTLRAQVLQALHHDGKTTIGITSTNPDEGKTLTAVNLAIATAMDENKTVLLVDADLREPGVAGCLGIDPLYGLEDYLTGTATITDCLVNPGIERLAILPAKTRMGNSAELLASSNMLQLVWELKTRYPNRLIIYDLPPVLTVSDTISFLPAIESTLLVVRDGATRTSDLSRALHLLANHNLIGTVLNAAQ